MGDVNITVETEAEIDTERLSAIIGDQLIVEGEGKPFSYLAGIAFDGMNGHGEDVVDILLEFLRNESSFDFSDAEIEALESILREGYDG